MKSRAVGKCDARSLCIPHESHSILSAITRAVHPRSVVASFATHWMAAPP